MTKTLFGFMAIMAVAVTTLAVTSPAHSQDVAVQDRLPKPAKAIFTTQLVKSDKINGRSTHVYKTFDRRGRQAGNFILLCWFAGSGGVLDSGISHCQGSIRLARGAIIVAGPIHRLRNYELAITGGTGYYMGVGGEMGNAETREDERYLISLDLLV